MLMYGASIEVSVESFDHLRLVLLDEFVFPIPLIGRSPPAVGLAHFPVSAGLLVAVAFSVVATKVILEAVWDFLQILDILRRPERSLPKLF